MKKNEHRKGYKKTQLGWIPEKWDVLSIGNFSKTFSGGTPDRKVKEYYKGDIPWIKSGELNSNIISITGECISIEGLNNSSSKIVETGTLLYALYGATAGISSFTAIKAAINQAILAIVPDESKLSPKFLNYWLRYNKESIVSTFCQGGQPNLSADIVKSLLVAIPPLLEQLKISAILETWDRAIERVERFIKLKEVLLSRYFDFLLIGLKRFQNLKNGKWKITSVGTIGEIFKGKGISKSEIMNEGIRCVHYGEIYTRYNFYFNHTFSYCNKESARNSQKILKGDILFAGSGETAEEIGKCVVYLGDEPAYAGGDIIVLRPRNENSIFLGFLLNHKSVNQQKSILGQGHSVVHIYPPGIAQLKIKLPGLEEQNRIASFLMKCNKEIQLLRRDVEALKIQKNGLMQKLLSGETRVKITKN